MGGVQGPGYNAMLSTTRSRRCIGGAWRKRSEDFPPARALQDAADTPETGMPFLPHPRWQCLVSCRHHMSVPSGRGAERGAG